MSIISESTHICEGQDIIARVNRGRIDGLHPVGKGRYIVSDWEGKTSLVNADGNVEVLMDTAAMKINAADIDYIGDKKIVLIPTFFDNRVVAYKAKL